MDKEFFVNYFILIIVAAVITWPLCEKQVGIISILVSYLAVFFQVLALYHTDIASRSTFKMWVVISIILNFSSPTVIVTMQGWELESKAGGILAWAGIGTICTFIVARHRGLKNA